MIVASYIKVIRIMQQLCGVGAIFALFALSFLLMALDLVGVLLIAKLIEEMFEPGSFYGFLSPYISIFGTQLAPYIAGWINDNALIFISTIFILRTGLSIWFLSSISRVIYGVRGKAEHELNKRIAVCDLDALRSQSKDELIRDIIVDLDLLNSCLRAVASITTECFVIISLLVGLCIFSLELFGIFLLVGLLFVGMMWLTITRLRSLGQLRRSLEARRYSNIFSLINLSSEIRVFNLAKTFLHKFDLHTDDLVETERLHFLLTFLHRYLAEISVLFTILGLTVSGYSKNFTPEIGILFGVAILRLLPMINRIGSSLNTLAFANSSLEVMAPKLLETKQSKWQVGASFEQHTQPSNERGVRLRLKDFSMRIGQREVISNLNLSLPNAGLVSIVGPSGIGKTTFLEILLGLVKRNNGAIRWEGEIQLNEGSKVGYVPQNVYLMERSLNENINLFMQKDEAIFVQTLEALDIVDLYHSERKEMKLSDVGNVSGGERQRIGIARALINQSNVLILDEVTSNLDVAVAEKLLFQLKELAKQNLVLMVTHDPMVVKKSDSVIDLNQKSERK